MRSQIVSAVLVTATLLAVSAPAAAATRKESIRLDHAVVVGGSVLDAGTYGVEIAPGLDAVSFLRGKSVVATVPCKLGLTQVVYPGNAIHSRTDEAGRDRIVKIVLADSKLAIDLVTEAPGTPESPIAQAAD